MAKVFAEKCGVFGIYGHQDAAAFTVLGLHALQHRGQEAAGIISTDRKSFYIHRSHSHVGEGFGSEQVVAKLKGEIALGHNRYATRGGLATIQPLFVELELGGCALSHNGDLTNAASLRKALVKRGCLFQSEVDTELFTHLLALSKAEGLLNRLSDALHQVEGAYSMVLMTKDKMIGVRDPYGVRPLVLGKLGKATIICSETCALDIIGAEFVRDIRPGEVLLVDKKGMRSYQPFLSTNPHFCIFEYVYFSRPDSVVEGRSVYHVRKRIGKNLAAEAPAKADLVVPVADSGVAAALGYAEAAGLPFDLGLIRNHYVGRTFIEPAQKIRHLGVRLKHNANKAVIEGKKIVLVDDSIVRGTTCQKIVTMLRAAGAKEIHMRIGAPPIRHSCFYGVDTPRRRNLIAASKTPEQIAKALKVNSLVFLSMEGLRRAVLNGDGNTNFCEACFSGDYPIPLIDRNLEKNKQPLLAEPEI